MRFESLEIKVAISGNSLLSNDMKISLGLLITVQKMHALFRENHYLYKQSNSRIESRTQNSKQILELSDPILSFNSVYRTNNRSEQHLDDFCRNIAILDSLKHVLASILLQGTSELVNK